MEIMAWNCRGIGNDAYVQALCVLIQKHKPDFIFLSETKVSDVNYMTNLHLKVGYLNCEAVFSQGQSGGLALFWCDGLDVCFQWKSSHHVDIEIKETDGSGQQWRLTGFYGHPTTSERFRTSALLRELSATSSLPWLVIGDYNEILHIAEKEGGAPWREAQMQLMRDALAHCDLHDLGFSGSPFTWQGGG